MTDLDLLDLTASLYNPAAKWNFLADDPECWAAVKYVDGGSVVVFRGSVTLLDWFRDLSEEPVDDRQLGPVHGGFFIGVRDKYAALMAACTGMVTVTGHSLGAARAMLFAGLMISNGTVPVKIRTWGCPRPGFKKLAIFVSKCPDAIWWRNASDPVTFVPWRGGLFKHAGAMRQVHAPGDDGDDWGFLRDHHIEKYREGMVLAGAVT